jgi:outer membrane protein OmpA-like peptidoglycan-associated protein
MAGGSTSSREQNFWPGFVDALTNVVLVMVLVVVVFAICMFSALMKVSKVHVQQNVEKQLEKKGAESDALVLQAQIEVQVEREKKEELQKEIQTLTAALDAAQQNACSIAPIAEGDAAAPKHTLTPVAISGRMPAIDISYALGVTTLEQKLMDALDAALGSFSPAGRWKVLLQANTAEPSPSEARRLAFYRIAVLRDHLVSKGVSPKNIETVITSKPSNDGRSHVFVRIRNQP